MIYKYCEDQNFEDFASGKVLIHRTGYPNFPVRLAQEIFCRCVQYLDDPGRVSLYDPCCGGGYLVTTLGFLNYERIETIAASDISEEAVRLAGENLSLLHKSGIEQRIRQLNRLLSLHHKNSHMEALNSAEKLWNIVKNASHELKFDVFQADVLSSRAPDRQAFQADIIFTDVPYGNLVQWQHDKEENVNLLDQLLPVTKENSVVAICSDKSQKFRSEHFQRVEKQAVGKRLFQIYRLT